VAARLYITVDQPNIEKSLEINIFRICQEALTNITKYAEATIVEVLIEQSSNQLLVKITDNGVGIKSGTLHNPLSMGLLNMRERANLMGAELNINSSRREGTVIELIVNKCQKIY
jgi:signal transduction histidine kinase